MTSTKARTPWFPTYSSTQQLLRLLPGIQVSEFRQMQLDIENQQGTTANPVDWGDPDQWIQERLSGTSQQIALRLWTESRKGCNPRHIAGQMRLAHNYAFLETREGTFRLTRRGRAFQQSNAELLQEIDNEEGLIQLLLILSGMDSGQRKDILPEWRAFLLEHGDARAEATISSKMYDRLVNLVERELVRREGNRYQLTNKGEAYLNQVVPEQNSPRRILDKAARQYQQDERKKLKSLLAQMHPYRFEHLIKQLLVAMGYENVQVTRQAGDRGIDVMGTARFGITSITEMVQVKRTENSIGRPTLDALRGALVLAGAVKGTIITLGRFSAGAQAAAIHPGAFPIGLIDGETLLDLLIEHNVGVSSRVIPVFEVSEEAFSAQPPQEETEDLEG